MIFYLTVDRIIRLSDRKAVPFAGFLLLVIFSAAEFSFAGVSSSDFVSAVPGVYSPRLEVRWDSLPDDSSSLDREIARVKKCGLGGLFLTSVPTGSNSWKNITAVADICRKHSMKLACDFFPQNEHPDILYNILWTNRIVEAGNCDSRTSTQAFVRENEHLIARFFMPLSFSNNVARVHVQGFKEPSPGKSCRQFVIKRVPADPIAVNYLDEKEFKRTVNSFLLNAQLRLRNNYGNVFDIVRFPSVSNPLMVWAKNLPGWFERNTGSDPASHLPALLFSAEADDVSTKNARMRYERSLRRLWRENFADNVQPLVHEAGLKAAISVNATPLPPEELGMFFQYPVAVGSTNTFQRILNRRMPGGVNIYSSSPLTGLLYMDDSELRAVIDSLFVDGAIRIIFGGKTDGHSFEHTCFASLRALCAYVNRCSMLLQNSEPADGIFLVSESVPPSLNRFIFDSVTLRMLKDAEIQDGKIMFPSGRKSSVIVFSDDAMTRNKSLVNEFVNSEVRVLSPSDIETLVPDFSWKSTEKNLKLRFTRRKGFSSDLFLIKNESDVSCTADMIFRTGGVRQVTRWQPEDGKVIKIPDFRETAPDRCILTLPVRAGELFFIVFDH
ncbi:MAG: hypothetical protein R6V06_03010 [Kiritimatiellia bacterium]